MQLAFFKIASGDSVAAEELNQFLRSHRTLNVEKHFHSDSLGSFWSVCVTWIGGETPEAERKATSSKIDYKTELSETEFSVFSELRVTRKALAEAEGVPVYAVATNAQLASMVQERVDSIAAFKRISGFGSVKAERFGHSFLEAITPRLPDLAADRTKTSLLSDDATPKTH